MNPLLPLLIFVLLVYPSFVNAQNPSNTVPVVQAQGNPIEDFTAFIESIFTKKIDKNLTDFNKANLPIDVNGSTGQVQGMAENDNTAVRNIAGQYSIAAGLSTPQEVVQATSNPLEMFIGFLESVIFSKGNENARLFEDKNLPIGIADKVPGTSQVNLSDMEKSLPIVQKSELPLGVELNPPTTAPAIPNQDKTAPTTVSNNIPVPNNGKTLTYTIPIFTSNNSETGSIEEASTKLANNMESLAAVEKNKWPGSLIDKWRDVYDRANEAGWNQALVLALWIEETGASDVCTLAENKYTYVNDEIQKEKLVARFGIWDIGVTSLPKTLCGDSDEVKTQKLNDQLTALLNMKNKISEPQTFEKFMCRYSEGITNGDSCTFTINPGFVDRLKPVYDCLTSDNPGPGTCPRGYFKFD